MTLEELGYTDALERTRTEAALPVRCSAASSAEHKERYVVRTEDGEVNAEVIGRLRATARDRLDFPAVGDWVALLMHEPGHATIHQVLPRSSVITRKAIGHLRRHPGHRRQRRPCLPGASRGPRLQHQPAGTLPDHLPRSGVRPIIVLTKIDLIDAQQVEDIVARIRAPDRERADHRHEHQDQGRLEVLRRSIEKGRTYCLLGSSGVGKSTLLNQLIGGEAMRTGSISESTNKGRHITSHRELVVLDGGGIIIDNPGMREVGIADAEGGLEGTFLDIAELARECRFTDCTHSTEIGCAVLAAVQRGELDEASLANYRKMKDEATHFRTTVAERRKKDKDFGKMVKRYKKDKGKM